VFLCRTLVARCIDAQPRLRRPRRRCVIARVDSAEGADVAVPQTYECLRIKGSSAVVRSPDIESVTQFSVTFARVELKKVDHDVVAELIRRFQSRSATRTK
jgi:hypothetical protein